MGRNRKWVLENDISEAVWRDDSSRSSATFQRLASLRTQCVSRHGEGSEEGSRVFGVAGENVKKAESKPVRPVSRSPDEARADAVARVASLEAAIAALGDHDDQVRKSLEESLAKAKKSTNVAPVGVRLNSAMKFIERIQKRVATKDAEIAKKEEEVRLLQSQRAEEMASLVAAEARLESLRAEAAPTNVPAPPLVNVEAEFRRMQRGDRRIASGTCPFQIQRDQSHGVRRGRQGNIGHRFARNPRRVGGRVQACSPVFWPLVERQWTHPR